MWFVFEFGYEYMELITELITVNYYRELTTEAPNLSSPYNKASIGPKPI